MFVPKNSIVVLVLIQSFQVYPKKQKVDTEFRCIYFQTLFLLISSLSRKAFSKSRTYCWKSINIGCFFRKSLLYLFILDRIYLWQRTVST